MNLTFRTRLFKTACMLGLSALTFGCVSTNTQNTQNLAQNQVTQNTRIIFEKTPCFGTCPSYEAEISGSGIVKYNGRNNVKRRGEFEMALPKATVNEILKEAERINFFSLKDEYVSGATDLPTSVITIIQPNRTKRIVIEDDAAPEELASLATYIHNQLDSRIVTDPMKQSEKVKNEPLAE